MDDLTHVILGELQHNRESIETLREQNGEEHREIMKALHGRVGRGELFGWLTVLGAAIGLIVAF